MGLSGLAGHVPARAGRAGIFACCHRPARGRFVTAADRGARDVARVGRVRARREQHLGKHRTAGHRASRQRLATIRVPLLAAEQVEELLLSSEDSNLGVIALPPLLLGLRRAYRRDCVVRHAQVGPSHLDSRS